jgi:FdhD protein
MKVRAKPRNLRTVPTSVARLGRQTREEREDRLAIEEPLEIRLAGRSISVVMRTPGEDPELAAGLLFTEGILAHRREVEKIEHCRDPETPGRCNVIDVIPRAPVDLSERGWQRNFVSSSSCGLCGKLTIESVHRHAPAVDDGLCVPARILLSLPGQLRSGQAGFDETGGLHAAGLFDHEGRLLCLREDIGRHNAVDKIIGAALLNDELPLSGRILMVSGRTSFEIVQKALMARIPFVAAVSAASSLAVELAESSRMGLVGFLRGEGMNAYAGAERILS